MRPYGEILEIVSAALTILATLLGIKQHFGRTGPAVSSGSSRGGALFFLVSAVAVVAVGLLLYQKFGPNDSLTLGAPLQEFADAAAAQGLVMVRTGRLEVTLPATRLAKFDVDHWLRLVRAQDVSLSDRDVELMSLKLTSLDGRTFEPPEVSYSIRQGAARLTRQATLSTRYDEKATALMASTLARNLRDGTDHSGIPYAKPE